MDTWRNITPVYDSTLSSAELLARGELFSVGDANLLPGWTSPRHWHDGYELGFVRSGKGVIVLGQREFPYTPGQIYIINSLEPHMGYTDAPDSVIFVAHFHSTILDEGWIARIRSEARLPFVSDFYTRNPVIPLDDPITTPVRTLLQALREEALKHGPLWDVIAGGLLIQAVGLLARRLVQEQPAPVADRARRLALQRIAPILHLIETCYTEPLSLEQMAAAAHISRAHCCALFQTAVGMAPVAYRNARRLTEARRLLQWGDLSIQEIAHRIGFSSAQEFNRLFRRTFGATPRQFAVGRHPNMSSEV